MQINFKVKAVNVRDLIDPFVTLLYVFESFFQKPFLVKKIQHKHFLNKNVIFWFVFVVVRIHEEELPSVFHLYL